MSTITILERISICIPLIVATTVLEIPAPSTPVECLFTIAGKCSGLYIHLHDDVWYKSFACTFQVLEFMLQSIVCESICACA